MHDVKLKDIAEIYSGLSYRRYLDDNGVECDVVVQRSIVLMRMPYPFDVVHPNQEGLVISDRIAIIRLDNNHDPAFIAHLLTNAHVKKQLHDIGSTERIPHISIKEIKEINLKIPDYETQVKYGELLNTINEKITQDLKVVEYDRRLKEGILNKLWGQDDE